MLRNKFFACASAAAGVAALFLLPACSVHVEKEGNGQDKQVDIKTLLGGIHVSQQADASAIGLAVYPGARLREKDSDGSDKSANVNISGFGYGLKVVAMEYESNDSPAKIVSFYKDQLKRYGNVLECRTSSLHPNTRLGSHDSSNDSNVLTCDGGDNGKDVELKAGRKDDQHIVAVEPDGKGANFSLVYVRAHGKEAEI
ncbi:MAG: hypothetical protein WB919_06520 [Candidatus Sulfotelmatobacter sp.]